MNKGEREALKSLYKCVEVVEAFLPEVKRLLPALIARGSKNFCGPEDHSSCAARYLTGLFQNVLRYQSTEILAQTIELLSRNDNLSPTERGVVLTIAEGLAKGKRTAVEAAISLDAEFDLSSRDFPHLISGAEKYGADEIRAAVYLAPRPSNTAELPGAEANWYPDEIWRSRQSLCVAVVASLGIRRTGKLLELLANEGFNWDHALGRTHAIAHSDNPDRDEASLRRAIAALKERNLPISGWLFSILHALEYTNGTIDEVEEILDLAAERGVKEIDCQNLGIALRYYRLPGLRYAVIDAFRDQKPNSLFWLRIIEAGAMMDHMIGQGYEETDRRVIFNNRRDAIARTHEVLEQRCYPRVGILGPERELIPALAENPLMVPALLSRRHWEAGRIGDIYDRMRDHYGESAVRAVFREYHNVEEAYLLFALLQMTPRELVELRHRIGFDETTGLIEAINWYGPKRTLQAFNIVRSTGKNPTLIVPTAASLAARHRRLTNVTVETGNVLLAPVLTAEHEQMLHAFWQFPPEQRTNLIRAVRLFRRSFQTIYERIKHAH